MTIGTATNVTLAFALLPVWWALAVGQIVWFPLALFILGKSWIVERRFRVERTVLILLGPFAVSYLASGTSNVGVLGFVDGGSASVLGPKPYS